jgi:hypothetical protein
LLPNLTEVVQFAVNEECTMYDPKKDESCEAYEYFLKPNLNATAPPAPGGRPIRRPRGKAVFHVEYAIFNFPNVTANGTTNGTASNSTNSTGTGVGTGTGTPVKPAVLLPELTNDADELKNYTGTKALMDKFCAKGTKFEGLFSTTIKILNLDGKVLYCDGAYADTKMNPLNPKLKGWAGECNITVKGHGEPAANGTTTLPAAEIAPYANGTTTTLATPSGNATAPAKASKQPVRRHL